MGDPSHLEKMGRELKCPICLSLLNSAVSLVSCNHVFCNACILKSMKSGSDCPVCKVPYQRREIRAAPHMDNLVSIYKSMEVASGFSIFVTQNTSSNKVADEQETDKNCSRKDTGGIHWETDNNQQNSISKKPRKVSKPSFPAKKRVQVPQYPLPETPTLPGKIEIGSDKSKEGGHKDSSVSLKKDPSLKEKGGSGLEPFFWLRDEENVDLSQHTDEDQLLYITPPDVPTFSDIKSLDDKSPCKSSPPGECSDKLDVAHLFDSEMFEWTQRPCSPELFSTPVKMQGGDADEFDGVRNRKSQSLSTGANKNMENKEAVKSKQKTDNADSVLPTVSSLKANSNNNQMKHSRSRERRKNSKKPAAQKVAKKNVDQGPEAFIELKKEPEKIMQKGALERGHSSSNSERNSKRSKKARFLACTTESKPESVSPSSDVEETVNLDDEGMDSGSIFSSSKKPNTDEGIDMRNRRVSRKVSKKCQIMEFPLMSKKRKLESIQINIAEEVPRIQNQIKADANPQVSMSSVLGVRDTNISNIKDKLNKNGREHNSSSSTACNQNLSCEKNRKVSFDSRSCGLVSNTQDRQVLVAAKKDQPTIQVGSVSEMETQNTGKVLGSVTPGILDNSEMLGNLRQPNGLSLRRCTILANEVKCAFCLSSDSSEASGEMVNYFNGRPVSSDFEGGSRVVHAHRNCTEWAPNVYFDDDIAINLEAELARSRRIRCCCCGLKGAALGCYEKSCRKSFHFTCAKLIPQCRWDTDNFVMLCPVHVSSKLPCEDSGIQERKKKECFPKSQMGNHCSQVILKSDISAHSNWKSFIGAEKLILCCSAVTSVERELVSEFEKLSGVKVLKNWDLKITHVVASTDESGACKRTLKVLMGILEGKWILNINWVKACMSAMKLVEEEPYEINVDIHGIRYGPQLGRLRILNKQPRIFEGLKFYFMGDLISSYKGYLQDLLIAGGGTILHRKPISGIRDQLVGSSTPSTFIIYSNDLPDKCDPSKKNIILSQRQADAEDLASTTAAKAVSNLWILNCIAGCKLQCVAG